MVTTTVSALQQAERTLSSAKTVIFWENAKHLLLYAVVGAVITMGLGGSYWLVKDPKIEVRTYGCSAGWNAKKGCKGKWLPLIEDKGPN